jgi:ABC-type sugar transport system permease subunit
MILAMLLNRPNMKFRGVYRAIIVLPYDFSYHRAGLKAEFHSSSVL